MSKDGITRRQLLSGIGAGSIGAAGCIARQMDKGGLEAVGGGARDAVNSFMAEEYKSEIRSSRKNSPP